MGVVESIYMKNSGRKPYSGKRKRDVLSLSDSIAAVKSSFGISIIGEFKRRSPSGFSNTFNADIRPYAGMLEEIGVSGISVLTEPEYFGGSYDDIAEIGEIPTPVLDKDFISDEKMIDYAYSAGADCILLIADFLNEEKITGLAKYAVSLSMEALVEFHDPENIGKIPEMEGVILGYNRRNLRTLQMEGHEMEIIDILKDKEVISVLESGLVAGEISDRMKGEFDAFLIGESLLNSAAGVSTL